MSNEFDDLPSGSGEPPTKDQVLVVYNYMRAHNRPHSTGKVLDEMKALGFITSRAAVGRALQGAEGRAAPPKLNGAEERRTRAKLNNRHEHKRQQKPKEPKPTVADVAASIAPETIGAITKRLVDLLQADDDGQPKKSSTMIAIEENRVAMALNIVIAETMAAKPELLLLDMRGTAALVDALTVARKLSGGAAIDISRPAGDATPASNGVSPGGYPMKELNGHAETGMASELSRFRREKAAERAQRN